MSLGTAERPLRVAVVGSGPSGFYAVKALFGSKDGLVSTVDMFDRLPTPFGLVRGGVAPDHQSIKRVVKQYEKLAGTEGFRFFGNVKLGRDLQVDELSARYDAVIWAVGNEDARSLGIEGEDLPGVHSATEFVFWYNAHPDYRDRTFDLANAHRAAVVGNGNVAMDVTRVLIRDREELASTDIADYALEELRASPLKEILLFGRRGAAQAAFSPKEIKEVSHLEGVDLVLAPGTLDLDEASQRWLAEGADRTAQKNLDILAANEVSGHDKKVHGLFGVSPVAFLGDGRLEAVRLRRNRLVWKDGRVRPEPTDEVWEEPAQLCFKAIGYRGIPIPGVPFDDWYGTIPNTEGSVDGLDGHYVVGWAKRGPSGLIGTNSPDSAATVKTLLAELRGTEGRELAGPVDDLLSERGVRVVTWNDWKRLDAEEVRRGEEQGRIRSKFSSIADALDFLG